MKLNVGSDTPRGHWRKGRRRNADVRPPAGWDDLGSFLADVAEFCRGNRKRREGTQADLARELDVYHSEVSAWLSQRKWPGQKRVNAIARWYKQRRTSCDKK